MLAFTSFGHVASGASERRPPVDSVQSSSAAAVLLGLLGLLGPRKQARHP